MIASKEEFIAAVHGFRLIMRQAGALAAQLEVLQNVYEGHDMFVWFPTGYGKSVCYQLLPYMFDVKFSQTSSPPSKRSVVFANHVDIVYLLHVFHLYSILIDAFTVCYTVRYPDYLAHVHKYTYSKYQASLLSVFGGLGSRVVFVSPVIP